MNDNNARMPRPPNALFTASFWYLCALFSAFLILITLFIDFFTISNGLFSPVLRLLSLLVEYLAKPLSIVEHPSSPSATGCAGWIFLVSLQSALFTEVVSAFRDDGICIRILADDARKWYSFQYSIIIVRIFIILCLLRSSHQLLVLGAYLPILVKLPALLIIFTGMEEFATVAEGRSLSACSLCKHLEQNP